MTSWKRSLCVGLGLQFAVATVFVSVLVVAPKEAEARCYTVRKRVCRYRRGRRRCYYRRVRRCDRARRCRWVRRRVRRRVCRYRRGRRYCFYRKTYRRVRRCY